MGEFVGVSRPFGTGYIPELTFLSISTFIRPLEKFVTFRGNDCVV